MKEMFVNHGGGGHGQRALTRLLSLEALSSGRGFSFWGGR
jgi:hypothetical protein